MNKSNLHFHLECFSLSPTYPQIIEIEHVDIPCEVVRLNESIHREVLVNRRESRTKRIKSIYNDDHPLNLLVDISL